MAHKDKKVAVKEVEVVENHMQIFARLASITNMHGTPGVRRGKAS